MVRMLVSLLTAVTLLASLGLAGAEELTAPPAAPDTSAIEPLMNLVAAAAAVMGEDQAMTTSDGRLSAGFVTKFFQLGMYADASLGITAETLSSPEQQAACLAQYFTAPAPDLAAIEKVETPDQMTGFRPMTANEAEAEIGVIGDLYLSNKTISQMTDDEFLQIQWLNTQAVFHFAKDAGAKLGCRVSSYSLTDLLSMEVALQNYFDTTLVEYMNGGIGFSIQYPSVFASEQLDEHKDGIGAKLADGSASFQVKRTANNGSTLEQLIDSAAAQGATTTIDPDISCGTTRSVSADGMVSYRILVVTKNYVYEASLTYRKNLAKEYSQYEKYMFNTFMVDEISVG